MEKSKGHIGFQGNSELYQINGQVYSAPIGNCFDVRTGARIGRWECSVEQFNRFRQLFVLDAE